MASMTSMYMTAIEVKNISIEYIEVIKIVSRNINFYMGKNKNQWCYGCYEVVFSFVAQRPRYHSNYCRKYLFTVVN